MRIIIFLFIYENDWNTSKNACFLDPNEVRMSRMGSDLTANEKGFAVRNSASMRSTCTRLSKQMSNVLLNKISGIPIETQPRHPVFGTGTENGMTGWRLCGDSWIFIELNDWHLSAKLGINAVSSHPSVSWLTCSTVVVYVDVLSTFRISHF